MLPQLYFTGWDWALMAVVSAMATALAYQRHPKWKALILSLPLPFSLAFLSVDQPVDATNVMGLLLLLAFVHGVRLFYRRWGWPIAAAIAVAVALYCGLAIGLARILPKTAGAFWSAAAGVGAVAVAFNWLMPHRPEPGHRTSLPVWIKLPIVIGVVVFIIIAKKQLQGFMTAFPMVTVIGLYEARHCLWTICRQVPLMLLMMLPMMATIWLVQPWIGYRWALIPGWIVFLAILIPLTRRQWRRYYADELESV